MMRTRLTEQLPDWKVQALAPPIANCASGQERGDSHHDESGRWDPFGCFERRGGRRKKCVSRSTLRGTHPDPIGVARSMTFVAMLFARVTKKARNLSSTGPTILRPSEMAARERRISEGERPHDDGVASFVPGMPRWARWRMEGYSKSQLSWIHYSFELDESSAQLAMKSQRSIGLRARHLKVADVHPRRISNHRVGGERGQPSVPKPEPTLEQIEITQLQRELTNLWAAEGRTGSAMPRSKLKLLQLIAEASARAPRT